MIKKSMILLLIATFLLSAIGCGHLKRPFKKNRGKKKGHNKSMMIHNTGSSVATIVIKKNLV